MERNCRSAGRGGALVDLMLKTRKGEVGCGLDRWEELVVGWIDCWIRMDPERTVAAAEGNGGWDRLGSRF